MEIKITIDPDGVVTTEVVGGCGRGCKDLTKPIREALGLTTSDRKLPEYYGENPIADRVKQGVKP